MKLVCILLFIFFSSAAHSQQQEKYLFPIEPGKTASLAGTLGELRSNHFHSGIDIRTNNEVGYSVYATKSGFISRVAMTANGYGNVLYIAHPDGNTSVYAHLDSFRNDVAEYVRQEQYRRKTFEIELFFRKDQFIIKQGDVIAISGNTGSSSGPHLHFDIRGTDNRVALDPLTFDFKEVVDTLPPYTEKIALKTMNIQSRINDRFGRFEFYAVRKGNDYEIPVPILASGSIGIEIIAKDKMANHSSFFGGVNFIDVYADNKLVFSQNISQLDISEGRVINTLLSFRALRESNSKFYKLYIDDGNNLPFYSSSYGSGKIEMGLANEKAIKIISRDVFGNKSSLRFTLRNSEPSALLIFDNPIKQKLNAEIVDNTLRITASKALNTDTALIFANGTQTLLRFAYSGTYTNTFLLDLKKSMPDSICIGTEKYISYFKTKIPASDSFTFYSKEADIIFPKGSLYDTLYFQQQTFMRKDSAEALRIGNVFVPLHTSVSVAWKPSHVKWDVASAIYRIVGNNLSYIGGTYTNGRVQFSTREFGNFTIARDTLSPSIKVISLNPVAARFRIKDDLSGVDSYEASLNGQWLLMHFDSKSGTLRAEPLNASQLLKGEFLLTVIDRVGNKQVFKQLIL